MTDNIDDIQAMLMELEDLEDKLSILEIEYKNETNTDRKALLKTEIEQIHARINALRMMLR